MTLLNPGRIAQEEGVPYPAHHRLEHDHPTRSAVNASLTCETPSFATAAISATSSSQPQKNKRINYLPHPIPTPDTRYPTPNTLPLAHPPTRPPFHSPTHPPCPPPSSPPKPPPSNSTTTSNTPTRAYSAKSSGKTTFANTACFCLAANTEISEHTSTRNATVQVVEGAGALTLNGERIPLKPGVFIFMAAECSPRPGSRFKPGVCAYLVRSSII